MKDTLDKLEEAEYFLGQMVENIVNVTNFKFNLSAFLSSARSITYIMQKEFSHKSGFTTWYKIKQQKFALYPIMKLMNDKRVISIHTQPIRPRKETHVKFLNTVTLTEDFVAFVLHADGTSEIRQTNNKELNKQTILDTDNKPEVSHLWYFDDIPDQDVVSIAKGYLDLLRETTIECVSKYS